MIVALSSFAGVGWQLLDNNAVPLANGKIFTYEAGTTTSAATYTTSAGNIPHDNPIRLDAAGRLPSGQMWIEQDSSYKFVLTTASDVLIATYDNIPNNGNVTWSVENFTGDGSTLIFTLTGTPKTENNTWVYINGVYQNKNTYSISGTSLIFSEAPPITSIIEVTYF
jgi:hypothetical protein